MKNQIRERYMQIENIFRRAFVILGTAVVMSNAIAQTSGSTTPEVQSFTPTGADNMVNLFTGDFQYSIPLMDVGGYPINISYGSGVGMNDEAGMVGLGWNFNPGVINRTVKGLPDDFNGEEIIKTSKIRPNQTFSIMATLSPELGDRNLNLPTGATGSQGSTDSSGATGSQGTIRTSVAITYNNYRGLDFSLAISPSVNICGALSAGLTLETGSNGASMSPNINVQLGQKGGSMKYGLGLSTSVGSLEGVQGVTVSPSIHYTKSSTTATEESTNNSKSSGDKTFKFGTSFSLGTAKPPFTPNIGNGSINRNYWLSFQTGFNFAFAHGSLEGRGSYSIQKQKRNNEDVKKPSYGYLYLQNNKGGGLYDKSNEKMRSVNTVDRSLYLTYLEPDAFNVSAEGFSGNFRPFRSDVGSANECEANSDDITAGMGIEAHFGNIIHGGGDFNFSKGKSSTEIWNIASSAFGFKKESKIYFKNIGEMNVLNSENQFNLSGGFGATKLNVNTGSTLEHNNGGFGTVSAGNSLTKSKENTNTQFTYLTVDEAASGGLFRSIYNYEFEPIPFSSAPVQNLFYRINHDANGFRYKTLSRKLHSDHHIAEVIVTAENGTRYVFSVPAYNTEQREYSFDVTTDDQDNNLVSFTTEEASKNNNADTKTKMYNCVQTPPYAYAYYLSAILSQDYVDITGDGPTSDDYGTYTRFNYSRVYENFQWKNPTETGKANFNEGYLSDTNDESASFTTGKKEIWYLHSIESRNMLALFKYTERNDAMEAKVNDESQNFVQRKLFRLSEIKLYSKADWVKNMIQNPTGPPVSSSVAIKAVKFNYGEELCKGVYAPGVSNQGKLTLKGIQFSYADSRKEQRSGYSFTYSSENPDYNISKVDRWGAYTNQRAMGMPFTRAPYTPQFNRELSDKDASAWNLTQINTPNGGVINIKYEADDYGYVQDKPAMQMYKILGFAKNRSDSPQLNLYTGQGSLTQYNNYVFFELGTKDPSVTYNNDYLVPYLKDLKQLYTNVQVEGNSASQNSYRENVETFVKLKNNFDYGIVDNPSSNTLIGYIQIGNSSSRIGDINPISFNTWQKITHERRDLVLQPLVSQNLPDEGNVSINVLKNFALGLVGSFTSLIDIIKSYPTKMTEKGIGKTINAQQSFLRLYNPDGKKIGGGSRVAEITISDTWDAMTQNAMPSKTYGNKYIYDLVDGTSSGVASYEPSLGGEENPFLVEDYEVPIGGFSKLSNPLVRSIHPYGEMRLPAPSVGYSRVTVVPINPKESEIKQHRAGYTVSEYYTAKDFPTILERTQLPEIKPEFDLPRFVVPMTSVVNKSGARYRTSQGFYIELNDMHGKPKGNFVFADGNSKPISGTEYKYRRMTNNSKRLDNSAKVINFSKNGTASISNKLIGVDFDFFSEFTTVKTYSYTPTAGANGQGWITGPVPLGIADIRLNFNLSQYELNMALTNKVVYRSGIIDSVITYDNGAKVEAENVAFDAKTGAVLITKTNNEFNEPYYTTTIPAHAVKPEMNFASINEGEFGELGIWRTGSSDPIHEIHSMTNTNISELNGGEELFVRGKSIGMDLGADDLSRYISKAWVYKQNGRYFLMNAKGESLVEGLYIYKIIRSGYHNLQTAPLMNVITKTNPIAGDNLDFKNVIDASATDYSQIWQSYRAFKPNLPRVVCQCSQTTDETDPIPLLQMQGEFGENNTTLPENNNFCNILHYDCDVAPEGLQRSPNVVVSGDMITVEMRDNPIKPYDQRKNDCTLNFHFHQPLPLNIVSIEIVPGSIERPPLPELPLNLDDDSPVTSIYQGCDDSNRWKGKMKFTYSEDCGDGTKSIVMDFDLISDCSTSLNCVLNDEGTNAEGITNPECNLVQQSTTFVNPYVMGLRGIWRPSSTYKFITQRNYSNNSAGSLLSALKDKGTYFTFHSFFQHANLLPHRIYPATSDGFWQRADINLITDPYGRSLETLDALNRPSSQVYGYNHQLPLATSVNAHYYDIAFDGFEDYIYKIQSSDPFAECDNLPHSQFYQKLTTNQPLVFVQDKPLVLPPVCIAGFQSHTGRNALCLNENSITLTKNVENVCDIPEVPDNNNILNLGDQNVTGLYQLQQCDLIRTHTPNKEGKKFILSAWVKEDIDIDNLNATYATIKVQTVDNNGSVTVLAELQPSGKLINNWRQVTGEFTIPSSIKNIAFVLNSGGDGKVAYFDDIRIFPYHSTMKTHVFDPVNLRMMAELDEQNFATFYEYDDEGQLTRTKKETEKGIVTIQEVRNAKPKN